MMQLTSVFKSFFLTVLLWAAIALLIVHPATGNLLLAETGSSQQKPDSVETQTSQPVEEKSKDSSQPAEKPEKSTVRSQENPASPYDMQEIERFDDDLYGT